MSQFLKITGGNLSSPVNLVTDKSSSLVGAYANSNSSSIAIGSNSKCVHSNSIAIGTRVRINGENSIAIGNIYCDYENSIAIGFGSTYANSNCVALGFNTTAKYFNAIAIGRNCKANSRSNYGSSGTTSIAIGNSCDAGSAGIAIGYNVRHNTADWGSWLIGTDIKVSEQGTVAIGSNINIPDGSGGQSVLIGRKVNCRNRGLSVVAIGESSAADSDYSVAIGSNAQANDRGVVIGHSARALHWGSVAIGMAAVSTAENGIQLGSATDVSSLRCKVALTVTSDIRDKIDIENLQDSALDFINELQPITYVFNDRQKYIPERKDFTEEDNENLSKYAFVNYDKEEWAKGTKKGTRRRVGVSAQNLQEKLQKYYQSDNYANIVDDNFHDFTDEERAAIPEGIENQLTVNYTGLIPFLVKSIQILSAENKEIKAQLASILG